MEGLSRSQKTVWEKMRSLSVLRDDFRKPFETVLASFEIRSDHELLVTCTRRTPAEQARIYRSSRSFVQITRKAERLVTANFKELADILLSVGPVPGKLGRHRTMAGPGESWHQYDEAADVVLVIDGKLVWDDGATDLDEELWELYGSLCKEQGLQWAGFWTNFREMPHCQLRQGGNPLRILDLDDVLQMVEFTT